MSTRRTNKIPRKSGLVALIGTGPGDPELLTVRARTTLAAADLVVADPGVAEGVLALVPADAELTGPEGDGVQSLIAAARDGKTAVRLLPGDVMSSVAGVDAALAVRKAKQPLEVVPGLPDDVAVPAYAGLSVTGARTIADGDENADWAGLAATPGTLLLRITAGDAAAAAATLAAHGRATDSAVALTVFGVSTRQRTVTATLGTLDAGVAARLGAAAATPALLTVGEGARSRDRLAWWEDRPLAGWRVLVPRTRDQAGSVVAALHTLGAEPVEVPTIAVEAPRTPAPMERAIRGLVGGRYAWVAFTSANAVKAVREKLEEVGLDARAFSGVKVAAIGEATAAVLLDFGIRADLVPSGQQTSEGLLADFPPHDAQLDLLDRVLLPRADIATETLAAGLKQRGWAIDDVTAYRTVRAPAPPLPVREALRTGGIDAALFTSSSTVRNLVALAGRPHERTVIGVIGPQTAATAAELGLRVDFQPAQAGIDGLVEELVAFAAAKKAEADEPAAPAKARAKTTAKPAAKAPAKPAAKAPAKAAGKR
ncbi:MAG TPA: uroporphyrinogen-III synthase [Mycobacteriales bacterium]|nr:uroporphyrinogen-III synthase [Mycobacteriales bacterium]